MQITQTHETHIQKHFATLSLISSLKYSRWQTEWLPQYKNKKKKKKKKKTENKKHRKVMHKPKCH